MSGNFSLPIISFLGQRPHVLCLKIDVQKRKEVDFITKFQQIYYPEQTSLVLPKTSSQDIANARVGE
jgi:hypothetical protein